MDGPPHEVPLEQYLFNLVQDDVLEQVEQWEAAHAARARQRA